MTLPLVAAPPPLRLEITRPGRDADGRFVFGLIFVDDGSRTVVWSGNSYEEAILGAEAWEADGVEVVDLVTDSIGFGGSA